MNEHDSFRMMKVLEQEGYTSTPVPDDADLVILNTCSVRENPENKVYSQLGRIRALKKKNPEMIVGVGGCVAQQEGENILVREKSVDMVFGTDQLFYLPRILKKVENGERIVATEWMPREKKVQNFIPDPELHHGHLEGCKAYLAITKGCNNFCTYCIVPTTRGREVSRELDNIIVEAKDLIERGAKEIMLLGQNVNSYIAREKTFYDLLQAVSELDGLKRLRFTSPHPNDWENRLTDLMAENPVICNQLHIPFQAGADKILTAMHRGHSQKEYLEKTDYLQTKIPGIALSTDLIVGFPGETDADFEETMKVLEHVRFHQIYAFKYSERPGTKAADMEDDVLQKVKEERLARVLDTQNQIQSELLNEMLGTTQEILIDSAHPKERFTMNGRTGGAVPVNIPKCEHEIGDLVQVKITGRKTHSLTGELA